MKLSGSMEKVSPVPDDTAIKLETGEEGPLELADILGLDTLYSE